MNFCCSVDYKLLVFEWVQIKAMGIKEAKNVNSLWYLYYQEICQFKLTVLFLSYQYI